MLYKRSETDLKDSWLILEASIYFSNCVYLWVVLDLGGWYEETYDSGTGVESDTGVIVYYFRIDTEPDWIK